MKVFCNKCKCFSSGITKFGKLPSQCNAKSNWRDSPICKDGVMISTPNKKNKDNNCVDFGERKSFWNYLFK